MPEIVHDVPATVSFSNTFGSAFNPDTGAVAKNPNSSVFWDGFHPTAPVRYAAGWFLFQTAFPGIIPVPAAMQQFEELEEELKGNLAVREPLQLGGTGMSSDDLPTVLKLLQVQGGITHQLLLGGGK
jgi:hypothetical protein